MKNKYTFLIFSAVLMLQLFFAVPVFSYSIMLPDSPPSPALPYVAEADHYSGPACVQMILNTCPNTSKRHYQDQDDIYNSILSRNIEPTLWFSDPKGIEGALEDPIFLPCGNWSDYSNTDMAYTLGKLLYYMKTMKYLMPVNIGSGEHWVTVMGYHTDAEPTASGTVQLQNIFFYDPMPGNPSTGWVSGDAWENDPTYWGTPLVNSSSSWNNKFIAVIEPPEVKLKVDIRRWILKGDVFPIDKLKSTIDKWLKTSISGKTDIGPFDVLRKEAAYQEPLLVKADKYAYYIILFNNTRIAAIFNAYNGSFEEIRYFANPQKKMITRKNLQGRLKEYLKNEKLEISEIAEPTLQYNPKYAELGRLSPVWVVPVVAQGKNKKKQKLEIILDLGGDVIKESARDIIKFRDQDIMIKDK